MDIGTEAGKIQTFFENSRWKSRVGYFLQEKDKLVVSLWVENLDPLAH